MSTQVQYRRGTATENNAFTGALAEITVDTTNWILRVHDGSTVGGYTLVGLTTTQTLTNKTLTSPTIATATFSGTSTGSANLNLTGFVTASGNVTGGNLVTAGVVSATGNVSGGNLNVTGNIVDTGALSIITGSSGNISLAPNGTNVIVATTTGANITGTLNSSGNANVGNLGTAGLVVATGNVTGGNLVTAGLLSVNSGNSAGTVITNAGGNGVGNIGSASGFFNTAHVKATSAQYADVAEKYVADRPYEPGTVLEIGGSAEVTATTSFRSTRIAGVVSTNPAFIMNSGELNVNAVELALLGRVPCQVVGKINKGDMLCSSSISGVATADPTPTLGSVIGKALESYDSNDVGIIEVLVGKV